MTTSPTGARNPRAFTLVELLTVIAIIAILAALLLPTLRTVRERVKVVRCVNNLRQVHAAILHYANDFDGWIPGGDTWTDDCGDDDGWAVLIRAGYIPPRGNSGSDRLRLQRAGHLLDCPGQQTAIICPTYPFGGHANYGRYASYGYWSCQGKGAPFQWFPRRMADLGVTQCGANPWRVLAACNVGMEGNGSCGSYPPSNPTHGDRGLNVLWGDGSVRWLSRTSPGATNGWTNSRNKDSPFWIWVENPNSY
jgi:prepilin-type N-terminal cleavage/methylation domain-containing protein/prepilin-type processing-associated H-X9-DG protein